MCLDTFIHMYLIEFSSAKKFVEIMFLVAFVCVCVCVSVDAITQKVMDGFSSNLGEYSDLTR